MIEHWTIEDQYTGADWREVVTCRPGSLLLSVAGRSAALVDDAGGLVDCRLSAWLTESVAHADEPSVAAAMRAAQSAMPSAAVAYAITDAITVAVFGDLEMAATTTATEMVIRSNNRPGCIEFIDLPADLLSLRISHANRRLADPGQSDRRAVASEVRASSVFLDFCGPQSAISTAFGSQTLLNK